MAPYLPAQYLLVSYHLPVNFPPHSPVHSILHWIRCKTGRCLSIYLNLTFMHWPPCGKFFYYRAPCSHTPLSIYLWAHITTLSYVSLTYYNKLTTFCTFISTIYSHHCWLDWCGYMYLHVPKTIIFIAVRGEVDSSTYNTWVSHTHSPFSTAFISEID